MNYEIKNMKKQKKQKNLQKAEGKNYSFLKKITKNIMKFIRKNILMKFLLGKIGKI